MHVRTYLRERTARGRIFACRSHQRSPWKRKIIERAVYVMAREIREANAERMTGNEKFQEIDAEREYRYDDFFEAEQSLESEEEKLREEREGGEEEGEPRRL